jgi:Ran-binding protein 1
MSELEEQKPKEETTVAASEVEEPEAEGEANLEEETSTAVFKPVVQLEDVEVQSGEEEEEIVFSMRGRLYRFRESLLDKGTGKKQWVERGSGELKILKCESFDAFPPRVTWSGFRSQAPRDRAAALVDAPR